MEEKKMTKKEFYAELLEIVDSSNVDNKEDVRDFINQQITMIDTKAEKAKAKAAEKKAEGDSLRQIVKDALTEEFQTIEDILTKISDKAEDITKAKVVARLTQLIKLGEVEKQYGTSEDNKKRTEYKKI